jgi:cation diffusion facilitator family transporter
MAESRIAVYAATAGNTVVAAMKFTAAAFTGSSSSSRMASTPRSMRRTKAFSCWLGAAAAVPNDLHPFGHGQEFYFWTLIVDLIIFTAGGAASVYEGILKTLHPSSPDTSAWNYIVLAGAGIFEGISFIIGLRQLRKTYPRRGLFAVLRAAKDPTIFTVVFEDASDLLGLLIAFLGVYLSATLGSWVFDGLAMLIGLMLMAIAFLLVRERPRPLNGRSRQLRRRRAIRRILEADSDVASVAPPLTMYFGPETVLLAVEIRFRPELSGDEVARSIDRLEATVKSKHPKVKRVFVEAAGLSHREG